MSIVVEQHKLHRKPLMHGRVHYHAVQKNTLSPAITTVRPLLTPRTPCRSRRRNCGTDALHRSPNDHIASNDQYPHAERSVSPITSGCYQVCNKVSCIMPSAGSHGGLTAASIAHYITGSILVVERLPQPQCHPTRKSFDHLHLLDTSKCLVHRPPRGRFTRVRVR